ncbi:hypothetical protein J2Z40_002795 [Cytobacillus eiseniae]|uniref:SbsC C-terminal domain-containing protein n=1 Tax=Cytobacillus eiseniae TaxID=762947 RepID=A0ABS4RH57_9BACI|nr:Ig-like domain-containing protein [Cytobacillus eiseniae]MBP2242221.1 hypothetical protein [Cytobacillus eiseniae]
MNKNKAIKVLGASAIAASAFVATSPIGADAASAKDVQSSVKKAKDAGTVLKWAISTEGSADGTTRPWAQYNAAKVARDKAVAAVKTLPAAQRAGYLADIEQNVNLHINRTMYYIDAITAGEKISVKKAALEGQIAKNVIDDKTEAAYHELSTEIRKQAILLDRVYGQTTRDEIRNNYKKSAEAVRDSVKYEVSTKIELDLAKKALDANDTETADKHLAEAAKYMKQAKNEKMKASLVKTLDELEASVTPKVKSVSAVNATQLVVVFNKEMNVADVTADKFKLEGQAAPTVDVADDEKTVTLTYSNVQGENLVFTVEPIKTKANNEVSTERNVSTITYKDTVAPTISDVTYEYNVDGKTATSVIKFSEPLQSKGTISVNGTVEQSTDELATGTIKLTGLEVGKAYKVDIVGAIDKANNIANPITQTITVPAQVKDEVKPAASIHVDGNKVTLHFSEELSSLGTVKINGTDYASSFKKDTKENTKYVLDAQEAGVLDGVNFLQATIAVDGFKDLAKNTGEKVESQATLHADRTAPAFEAATVNKTNDKLLVSFNDKVVAGDLDASNELKLKMKNDVHQSAETLDLTAANTSFGYDVDQNGKIEGTEKNVLAINYAFDAKSTYTFELAGKVVADVYGNKVADALTLSVTAPELEVTPVKPEAVIAFDGVEVDGGVLTVSFNKEMSDSALVASNYTLGGKVLPTDTQLKFVDSKKNVEVTLPEGFITANGMYVLEATSLLDKDGNTLANGKATISKEMKENIAPTAGTIAVTSSKNVTVDFSEAIANNNSVTGVTVKVNGTVVETTSKKAENGKLAITMTNNFNSNDTISVEFKSANLVDMNGNKVKDGIVTK